MHGTLEILTLALSERGTQRWRLQAPAAETRANTVPSRELLYQFSRALGRPNLNYRAFKCLTTHRIPEVRYKSNVTSCSRPMTLDKKQVID